VEDPKPHLDELRARLRSWTQLIRDGATEEQFLTHAAAERNQTSRHPELAEKAMPLWQSYAGIKRYADKAAATIASR
jgi:hypothetical protein